MWGSFLGQEPLATTSVPTIRSCSLRIEDPREAAVALIHAFGIDAHAVCFQLLQQAIHVGYAQVQHELLLVVAEVIGVALERREHCRAGILLPDIAVRLIVDVEVFVVPAGKRFVIVRAEERIRGCQ